MSQSSFRKLTPWGLAESFLIIGAAEFYFQAKCDHYELLVFLCFNDDFL